MPCPKRKAAEPPSHRGWIQPARVKITAAVLNVTGLPARSWGETTKPTRERISELHLLLLWEQKYSAESPGSSIPTGGALLGWQNASGYGDESDWAGKYLWARNTPKVYPQKKSWTNQPSCDQITSGHRQDASKWNLPNFKSKTIRSKRSLLDATAQTNTRSPRPSQLPSECTGS